MNEPSIIQSAANPKFKRLKSLLTRKGRRREGRFLAEGWRVLEALADSDCLVEALVDCGELGSEEERVLERITEGRPEVERLSLSRERFLELSRADTPQRLMACAGGGPKPADDAALFSHPLVLAVEGIQDPRNFGAVLRVADALGLPALASVGGSPDPFHPLSIQASAGSAFHVSRRVFQETGEFVESARKAGALIFATDPRADRSCFEIEALTERTAVLALGNEGAGLSRELLEAADFRVRIPIHGRAESLNVASAAAVLGYHFKELSGR